MNTAHDYLIIGAGPAGLQLAYYMEKSGRDYLILEREKNPGAFFEKFPRHGMLISINKVFTGTDHPERNMRWDWNSLLSDEYELVFKNYTRRYFPTPDVLCRYLSDFAQRYQLRVQYNTSVVQVRKEDGLFHVTDAQGNTYLGRRLIVATGLFKPYIPDFPGVEYCDNYVTHNTDPELYRNKRVLILGKGNSAFETANHLVETAAAIHVCSPNSVKFAWQTHYVGHLRAVNNDFLDTYQLKSQNTVIDGTVMKVEREGNRYCVHIAYSHAKGQTTMREYDHVILCTGFQFDNSIFHESCRPELAIHNRFPAQTAEWESTNVPGMYFAGTLMQACDYKKTMSGFIHGFRYNVRTLSRLLEAKYHGTPWPSESVPLTPRAVLDKVLDRINNGSGIFLQPGFLQDVVVADEEAGMAHYYEDLRADYIHQSPFGANSHYYTVSLEYGHFMGDPFNIERDPSPERAHEAAYLHPVIRRFNQGRLVSEHHIQDDLESEWYLDEYVKPALAYFKSQLSATRDTQPILG